ncbi:MAG: alpha/beta hydrolase-fold protein [Gallionellaceae bacterium]
MISWNFATGFAFLLVILCCSSTLTQASQPPIDEAVSRPIIIPRAQQFDFQSKINGRSYRIMVATPAEAVAGVQYPALYVLDGNHFFGTALAAVARQSLSQLTKPAIVVGIGYPTDDLRVASQARVFDLTPSRPANPSELGSFGGAVLFAEVLEREIKPFIQQRFPVDRTKQVLWGHSFAGLFALTVLFNAPNSYSAYILSSPSIWWNNRVVLKDEPALTDRLSHLKMPISVLITSASEEQYRGNNPVLIARSGTARMIDNATELSQRLIKLNSSRLNPSLTFPRQKQSISALLFLNIVNNQWVYF